jgi:hypothetical protein
MLDNGIHALSPPIGGIYHRNRLITLANLTIKCVITNGGRLVIFHVPTLFVLVV